MKSNFLFNVGDTVKDVEVNDVRSIKARMYDVDKDSYYYTVKGLDSGSIMDVDVNLIHDYFFKV